MHTVSSPPHHASNTPPSHSPDSSSATDPVDVIGIGIGPFNLGLAALLDPLTSVSSHFFERHKHFSWHSGLVLPGTHLQVPFLADLVTMADPTSRYSFLNWLKTVGRLYPFYIRENFYPLRIGYIRYCQWVSQSLSSLHFGSEVVGVHYRDGHYTVHTDTDGQRQSWRARRLVLGTGTRAHLPPTAPPERPGRCLHSSQYAYHKDQLQQLPSVTILGSGQSAAEIFYDLLQEQPEHTYELTWLTRSPRFFPLEYTKLTLEMTSPDYIDHFFTLPHSTRERLSEQHKGLYKGIDQDLINDIYDLLYERSVDGAPPVRLMTSTSYQSAVHEGDYYHLQLQHTEEKRSMSHRTAGLIFATGYQYVPPAWLEGIRDRLTYDENGELVVDRYYSVSKVRGEVFAQNAELATHGFTAPDLGMGPYRNSCIIAQILGYEHYPIEKRIAFQRFGACTSSSPSADEQIPGELPTDETSPVRAEAVNTGAAV